MFLSIRLSLLFFIICSCVSPASFKDYALSSIAVKRAKQAGAHTLSPNFYLRADAYYRRGEISFRKQEYGQATEYFRKSRALAERSEEEAFLKKHTGQGGLY